MIFQNNIIKEYLKNVYFITGTPCGGKTTISRTLAKKYNLLVYDVDERFDSQVKLTDSIHQPAMNKNFENADDFFCRSVEEYKNWLFDNTREQLDIVLLDLIRLSQNQIVLCDCHLTTELAGEITERSKIVFLIKEPSNLIDDYCNRKDHKDFDEYINSASNVEFAKKNCNETLKRLHLENYTKIKNSDYFWLERNENSTVEETVKKVEHFFGFDAIKNEVQIEKLQNNSKLWSQTIGYAKDCTWSVGKHLAELLREGVFQDYECVFAALSGDKIIGFCTFLETDYYPENCYFPWISSIFVDEKYRGNRISEKLIQTAINHAREFGFDKVYIPSNIIGLYEKYGFRKIDELKNYDGEIDNIFMKEI